jgi:HD-like signal output (HDOD) protein/signal transduction histidine kinase
VNLPQSEDIRNRLLVAHLPSLPQTLLKLLALCQSDDAGMAELAQLIGSEPAMAAKVLSVAHSAAYHRSDQQLNLLQAANTLGTELIKVLVMSESVFQTFNAFTHAGSADLRQFWKHSLGVAVIAKDLAQRVDQALADEAYLAGLLHDVGRLALLAVVPQFYQSTFMRADDTQLCDAERHSLKISHTEAGAWLGGQWHLTNALAESILYHHADAERLQDTQSLTRLIHLAHRLSDLPQADPAIPDDFACEFALTVEELGAVRQNAATQVAQTARDLGVDISGPDAPLTPTTPAPAEAVSPLPADPAHAQLAQDVRNRSLLAAMAQTLASQNGTGAALASLRHHAGILLQLDDVLIMLLRDKLQTMVLASCSHKHTQEAELSPAVAGHPLVAHCVEQRKVGFSSRHDGLDMALLNAMQADHLVGIPLTTSKHCLGVMIAVVPPALLGHIQSQEQLLQAFGVQAGAALMRRRQTDRDREAHTASVHKEQQLTVKKLAHEVNNPISVIKNYLEVIDDKLSRDEPVRAELSRLGQEITRVGSIVDEFTDTVHATPFGPLDLGIITRDLVQLLRESRFFPAAIHISCLLPEHAIAVHGSLDQIRQILLNLIKNARECMPDGGRITISGGTPAERDGRPYTRFLVTDDGPGLTPELQARLFEPVHSHKLGEHRGVGLSIVHNLVTKMAGHISFSSAPAGTSFEILLPSTGAAQTGC